MHRLLTSPFPRSQREAFSYTWQLNFDAMAISRGSERTRRLHNVKDRVFHNACTNDLNMFRRQRISQGPHHFAHSSTDGGFTLRLRVTLGQHPGDTGTVATAHLKYTLCLTHFHFLFRESCEGTKTHITTRPDKRRSKK